MRAFTKIVVVVTLVAGIATWNAAASFASTPGSAAGATQTALAVTGAPASAPEGSSFIVGTAGGSGTGAVTFSVSGGCTTSSGHPQIAMTSSTVTCVITATKAGDANYDPITSAPVSVIATDAVPVSFATLQTFTGTNGAHPAGPLVQAADGWVYGLTVRSGADVSECASAFRFNPTDPAGTFATIWVGSNALFLGCNVWEGGLVGGGDDFYFVTSDGGPCNGGRIFHVSSGTVQPLADFYQCVNDGRLLNPGFGLTVGADGALYGVAAQGGVNQRGGVYRVALDGTLSTVLSFPADQSGQRDALVAGSDGRLYGTAATSVSFVYRVDPAAATVETLFTFATGGDGSFPRGRLLEVPPRAGQDIAFVGVAQGHGTYGAGVVYRVDVAGSTATFGKLHDFWAPTAYLGETPMAGLVRTADGTVYGTTYGYGLGGPGIPDSGELGTLYRIGPDGVVSKLFGGPPLIQPFGPLHIGTDGSLYGTSYVGDAAAPFGSVFRVILPGGAKTTPVITWPPPADIPYGTALGTTQLNATADVAGTLVYTPDAGTVLEVGAAQLLSVAFTPADTSLYELATASVLITVTKAAQAPLTVTGAPDSAVYGTSFSVAATGGTGTGAVNFDATGACSNTAGGTLITMTSGTGTCAITATKAGDANYESITSPAVWVTAIKAVQATLTVIGAPNAAPYDSSFTVDATGGSGTGALSFGASAACGNTAGGALITMISGAGTCVISATKAADLNYFEATAADVSVNATKATQAALTVTGAPASAPEGSSFIVGTAGGSGTGAVTFSVSGGCATSSGHPQIAMTSSTVTCVITATKAGDANYDPITSAPVSVIATDAVPVSFATLQTFTGTNGAHPAGPLVQAADGWVYGLTVRSGADVSECASAFRFNPTDPARTFATIWVGSNALFLGCNVWEGGLVGGGDDFYFVTSDGGPCNGGRIFHVSSGTVQPLADFYQCVNDGRLLNPGLGLTVGADGALYGVAAQGGVNQRGGVYRVALDGTLSTVLSFPAGQSGQRDALTTGTDGRLYGTAANFSLASFIYRVDPQSGVVETLYEFPTGASPTFSPNGSFPRGRLLEVPPHPGQDIAFVGVAQGHGTYGAGVVYRVDVAGSTATFGKLHDFWAPAAYLGETPMAGLVRTADGTVYGTTYGYGLGGPGIPDSGELGTLYRIGPDGVVSKLFGGPPLIQPFGPLLIGTDGSLYGTSYVGDAAAPFGSVFRVILPGGAKTTPVITWPTPADIPYGTALGPTQLNATADVPGTFAYTPDTDTVLNIGAAQLLAVAFTPTDTTLYNTASATVFINVIKATQAPLTVTGAPGSAVYGTTFTVDVTGGTGTGVVSVEASGACSNSAGGSLLTMTSGTGTCAITATKAGDANYESITSPAVSVTATKAVAVLTLSNLTQTHTGTPKSVTVTTNPTGLSSVSVTYNGSTTVPTNVGSYAVVAALTNNSYEATNATGTLIITTAALKTLTLSPKNVVGGVTVTGTVTLTAGAPTGGLSVSVSSSNTAGATVDSSVTVPAGSTSVQFTVSTFAVAAQTSIVISATSGGIAKAATLTVNPADLASLTLSATSGIGGISVTGTVTLTGAAPPLGAQVTLGSSQAAAQVPPSITVPFGQTSATFTMTTTPVAASVTATISASYRLLTKNRNFTVQAPALTSLILTPSTVQGGSASTGTVTLTGAAPAGGIVVNLTSGKPAVASVPASITVPAGSASVPFSIATTPVIPNTSVKIKATSGGISKTATLTVTP